MIAAVLVFGQAADASPQDSGQIPSMGDVARKSRQQLKAKDHTVSKHVLNEETAAAKGTIWTATACHTIPCAELSVVLPREAKMGSAVMSEQRIPLHGDSSHDVRLLQGNQLPASDLNTAKWVFLQDWFSRPYFFGSSAKFDFDETTKVDTFDAVITHFTVKSPMLKYRGIALFVAVPSGTFGFACIYRDEDSGDAAAICESVLNSAKVKMPDKYKYYTPPSYMQDDP
jgi:hypothetical protein